MKTQNILGNRVTNISTIFLLLLILQIVLEFPLPTSQAASVTASKVGTHANRQQSGLTSSGSFAVWEDRKILDLDKYKSTPYSLPDDRGTTDILGFDFSTNQPLTITTAAGDQTAPAISGSVIVWQDSGPSCFSCDRDIKAKDINTGVDYTVASGSSDQAFPSIDGQTVVWVENGTSLVSTQLGDQKTQTIATVPPGTSITAPVISSELIVWGEYTLGNNAIESVLRAYNRKTGVVKVINQSKLTTPSYAVSGHEIAWTDSNLMVTDVEVNTQVTIDRETFASFPSISGDTLYWSGNALGNPSLSQIYGYDLKAKTLKSLPLPPGRQNKPSIVGSNLLWQSDESSHSEILSLPIEQALVDPSSQAVSPTTNAQESPPQEANPVHSVVQPNGVTTTYTRPLYKGMHTANDIGWYISGTSPCNISSCPAIDGLGATYEPLFGSFLVLSSDLGKQTGRGGIWGPTVADAMKSIQTNYSVRVIVRLYPILYPNASGSTIPDQVAQQVINLAQNYDWIKNVQVENEPNHSQEWPDNNCLPSSNPPAYCQWNGKKYQWIDYLDYRKIQAINDFYTDAWWSINYYKNNYSDLTVRGRLQQMSIWTPPMATIAGFGANAGKLANGSSMYDYLQGMVGLYGLMTYHTYTDPRRDSVGTGVSNFNWDHEFNFWLQTQINNSTIRTMITEFGWDVGTMSYCGYGQYSTWSGSGVCAANNGLNHTFDGDISYFLANQRHKAEAVTVWIERGGPANANGIDASGNPYTWFHNYQFSSP